MAHLHAIQPRKVAFDVSDVPVFWNDGDPVLTRFFDALSVHFPDGERFFIQSVRNYQDQVADPKLKADVRNFFRQEAQHGIVHDQYNAVMAAQGINVEKIIRRMKFALHLTQKYLPPKYQLAMTAAFEHITATLGEGFMDENGEMFRNADPVMRAMFMWHGVEEVEHKAVAFDVYEQVAGGGYLTRTSALLVGTAMVHVIVGSVLWHMLKVDRLTGRPLLIARGLYRLYGPDGLLTRLIPAYLAWFRPGFHPWDSGIPEKVSAWLDEYQKDEDPLRASHVVFGDPSVRVAA
jgi:predicted metal-dependent hydrolase